MSRVTQLVADTEHDLLRLWAGEEHMEAHLLAAFTSAPEEAKLPMFIGALRFIRHASETHLPDVDDIVQLRNAITLANHEIELRNNE